MCIRDSTYLMYNRLRRDGGDGMAETPRSKRTLIRKGDMLVLVSLLAAALLLLLVMRLTARPGAEAVVTVPGGEFTPVSYTHLRGGASLRCHPCRDPRGGASLL